MNEDKNLGAIRREYGDLGLNECDMAADPITQFSRWFEEILYHGDSAYDPTAMVLSTICSKGIPDSRVVLLKGIDQNDFIFYTNYQSTKGIQIAHQPYAALNFYWPQLVRQVRIRGSVSQVQDTISDAYFSSRPLNSQFSAIASPQSREIHDRGVLEKKLQQLIDSHGKEAIMRPKNWGGYRVTPFEIEFWQGRNNRLHDRIQYYKEQDRWTFRRLAP